MYTHESLTSGLAYLEKTKSGWNILSTLIRAEVLCYMSKFLKDGFAKFGETQLFTNIKTHIISLFEKLENWQSYNCHQERSKACEIIMNSLKIITYLSLMIGATVIDNANKTAVFMWTADKLDKFEAIFVTWEMAVIMIGLISVDTFGNKYCNVEAKKELYKLWNVLKEQPQLVVNTNQANINGDIETPVDTITSDNLNEKEKELIQKFASEEASKTAYQQLLQRYDWNSFTLEITENQSQIFDSNQVNNTSYSSLSSNEKNIKIMKGK